MIQITPQIRIWVMIEAVDFRRGIGSPASRSFFWGHVCLPQQTGHGHQNFGLRWPRILALPETVEPGLLSLGPSALGERQKTLLAHELYLLLWNGSPLSGQVAPLWKGLPVTV